MSKLISTFVILFLTGIDQYSKFLVESRFQETINLLPGIFEINYSQNTGIAFSLLESFPQSLTVINSIIILGFIFFFFKTHSKLILVNLPSILIISGGLGNLFDRYTKGYVIDFINPTFIDFAIFNLADCFLNIGVFLLIGGIIFNAKPRS